MADIEENRRKSKVSKSLPAVKKTRKSRKRSHSSDSSEITGTASNSSSPVRKKSRNSKSKKRSKRSPSTESNASDSSSAEKNARKYKKAKRNEEKKKKDKKRRKKKSKSKDKKSMKSAVNQQKYGKYGILMESDMYNKQQEFYLWLLEVKKVNPETLPRFEMKNMFDTFAEDYNTVTLPHKKFYDLEKWETKQREKGKMKAFKKAQKKQVSIENDELQHKSLHSRTTGPEMSKEELLEMQRVMRERQQEDYKRKAGWKVDETKGVRYQTTLP